jgi:hypothetical protein
MGLEQSYTKVFQFHTRKKHYMKYLNYLPVILNNENHLVTGLNVGDVKIHMSLHLNGQDAEYWTNIDCTVHEDYKSWKKGDTVFIKYNEMREICGAYGVSNRIIFDGDNKVHLVNSDFVYLTIRDGEMIVPDGFSLVLPVKENKKKSEYVITIEKDEEDTYEKDVWQVIKVGGPSPLKELTFGTDAIPKEGWYVKVKKGRGVPLEAHLNKKLNDRYFLIRHNEVMAYEIR